MTVLQNAALIIKSFDSTCTELTVSDVVNRLGLPKANASRLLKAMREAGLLETIGNSKRHRPGRMLLQVGAAFRGSSFLIAKAGEVVQEVSAECGHTGFVSMRYGADVTGVLDFVGTNALRVAGTVGRRLPACSSATGRSLLARITDEEIRETLKNGIETVTEFSPTSVDQVIEQINQVREQGYASSHQETTLGVDAFAVAVGDPKTNETVSLCIVFPSLVVPQEARADILSKLCHGAAQIAELTGDPKFNLSELKAVA